MYGGKNTLYEVLGVNRSASAGDIVRAYRKLRAEMTAGVAADDPQGALVHEAYEVLSDPQRRAAYDASLRGSGFLRPTRMIAAGPKWGLIAAAAAAVLVGAYFALRPSGHAGASIPQEIVAAVSPAVGRVQSIDIQGRYTSLGHAFAIEKGVMVTTCQGFKANAQLVVSFGARKASAQLSRPDKTRDVCRLAVADAGSWPLPMATGEPAVGDKVYAASMNPAGDAIIVEGRVTGLIAVDGARAVEFTVPVTAAMSGGPLLDAQGRVVGMMAAQHPYGAGKNVALPAAWVAALRTRDR
jgi:S1-C subfamily serine protease